MKKFLLGVLVGSITSALVTLYLDRKMAFREEEVYEDPEDDILDEFNNAASSPNPIERPASPLGEKKLDLAEYARILHEKGYDYMGVVSPAKAAIDEKYLGTTKHPDDPPQDDAEFEYITPDDFGEMEGYSTSDYTFYADGVVTDEYDDPVENPLDIFGEGWNRHIGEYDDNFAYVRNHRLKLDCRIEDLDEQYRDTE